MKRKLSSRKLWAAGAGFVAGQIAALNPNNDRSIRIVGQLTSAACLLGFIFGESRADAAGAIPLVLPGVEDVETDDNSEDA